MRVTIDGSGRVVIPKSLRMTLGLNADSELEVVADGGGLRLDPVQPRDRVAHDRDGLPLLPRVEGSVLTDDDVRSLRDDLRR